MADESNRAARTRAPGTPPDAERIKAAFAALVDVVARLRAPDGCPWDRAQTLATIKPYTLEETFEVFEAIDAGDDPGLVEELGDLLLQVVLYAQIAADEERFDLIPVVEGITSKMLRRHPHVFGPDRAETAEHVLHHWDRAKQQEKSRDSVLDGVPAALPALARSSRLSAKAARAGYDLATSAEWWDRLAFIEQRLRGRVLNGSRESGAVTGEDGTIAPQDPEHGQLEADVGDLLYVVANIARKTGVNPEDALRKSNRRFEERVRRVEQTLLARTGKTLRDLPPDEARALYRETEGLGPTKPAAAGDADSRAG